MRIQLKRSSVLTDGLAKEPTSSQMEYGELAVNFNTADPCIFLKDSGDNIVRISGAGAPGGGGGAGDGLEQIDNGDNTFDLAVKVETGGGVGVSANGIKIGGAGNGIEEVDNGDNTYDFAVKVEAGTGLAVSASGVSIGGNWSNIPSLPE